MATKMFRDVVYLGSDISPNKYVVGLKGNIEVWERGTNGCIINAVMTFPEKRGYGPAPVKFPIFKTKTGLVVNGNKAGSADIKPWAKEAK